MVKGVGLFAVLKGLKLLSKLHTLELTPPKYNSDIMNSILRVFLTHRISDNFMGELQQTISGLEALKSLNLRFGAKEKK